MTEKDKADEIVAVVIPGVRLHFFGPMFTQRWTPEEGWTITETWPGQSRKDIKPWP